MGVLAITGTAFSGWFLAKTLPPDPQLYGIVLASLLAVNAFTMTRKEVGWALLSISYCFTMCFGMFFLGTHLYYVGLEGSASYFSSILQELTQKKW